MATHLGEVPQPGVDSRLDDAMSPGLATVTTVHGELDVSKERLRSLLQVVKAVRRGDFSVRMAIDGDGLIAEIGEVLNDIIELNEGLASEFVRVGKIVGQEGRMNERVSLGPVKGVWATSVD